VRERSETLGRDPQSSEGLQPLTVAMLGAGSMGTCLAKVFGKIPGAVVKYVYSRTFSHAKSLADQVNATPLDQMDRIFADGSIDVVVLCLPTHTRLETLRAAVQAKKHIFCEKPLALNKQMANEISELLSGYSGTVMVGQVLRFFWEYSRIHDMVRSGVLGQIGTVRFSRCVGFPGSDSWFADPEKSGGVILDLLIHDVDFLLWTFGEVKQIYAKSLNHSQQGNLDYALINIEMKSGALAHLEGSWAHPVGSFHQTIEICGSKGLLHYDNLSSKNFDWVSTVETKDKLKSRIYLPESGDNSDPYSSEVSHFVECVRNRRSPVVSIQDALKSCEIAFLAMDSARRGVPRSAGAN
jgi:UDP-N-acetylglucosamine 3-dehydrogenase